MGEKATLTILLKSGPYTREDAWTVVNIAEAALEKGYKVNLYLHGDAVLNADSHIEPVDKGEKSIAERLKELMGKGLSVSICPACASLRGLKNSDVVEGAVVTGFCSLGDWVMGSHRFISFTGGLHG